MEEGDDEGCRAVAGRSSPGVRWTGAWERDGQASTPGWDRLSPTPLE
ncbi:hypothetical protein SAZ11_41300 [Streptomyces sp. FXJ1.4098]|nr:hypothetical protein [Streptomyces sp. FXJ1.4098]